MDSLLIKLNHDIEILTEAINRNDPANLPLSTDAKNYASRNNLTWSDKYFKQGAINNYSLRKHLEL